MLMDECIRAMPVRWARDFFIAVEAPKDCAAPASVLRTARMAVQVLLLALVVVIALQTESVTMQMEVLLSMGFQAGVGSTFVVYIPSCNDECYFDINNFWSSLKILFSILTHSITTCGCL